MTQNDIKYIQRLMDAFELANKTIVKILDDNEDNMELVRTIKAYQVKLLALTKMGENETRN